ncbi:MULTISPECIES: inositol 2-dehydrogenase [unclassified Mesorhizobium]|uniref:inositol 2-dehydrogenase n=1 Tax=unclassified Mesorhizobium TaxID=325217 RepID=UPI000FCAE6AB|nr:MULTISPECIES: inositol 2-dehydrogenase [unclassified Mesorhizobium]TGP21527.1 inositol 2-dehydrogenase [Mesorhizobium sp. M1D.F.Ca.ET.231.01.1.1]TGP29007.1 inositol 2-dehydrogenase [Mesorhizobium sp. M1D.F.Ca.ET.234.01.1.1]TGS43442.1 inositol 2-dehydrogenase [Mesorhizobium sp. M1D.F.Ca.ET.184.01.1.1]TGS59989.1 inositol 2-dehydrogenase [Mesorhizobium sp. M1D.F.Ca.ET.183.01.1.1]
MVRFGILGCGRIGQVHAKSIQRIADARLVAVADVSPEAARSSGERFGAEVRKVADIVSASDIDAVVIATSTDTHYDMIRSAVGGRKAIFCEKAVDLSSGKVRICIKMVEDAGVPFMTAFNQRFDPHFGALQRRVADGEIGDVETVSIISRDPGPPPVSYLKASGGLFRDMMIHDLDMARFVLAEEPTKVFAVGSTLVDPAIKDVGDVDTAAVILTTASGKICQISNSRRATYGYDKRLEVHGSKGMLRAANLLENSIESATSRGFTVAKAQAFFLERFDAAYLAELQHFVEALLAGRKPRPDVHDGLRAQLIADAATQSRLEGRPIEIPV